MRFRGRFEDQWEFPPPPVVEIDVEIGEPAASDDSWPKYGTVVDAHALAQHADYSPVRSERYATDRLVGHCVEFSHRHRFDAPPRLSDRPIMYAVVDRGLRDYYSIGMGVLTPVSDG